MLAERQIYIQNVQQTGRHTQRKEKETDRARQKERDGDRERDSAKEQHPTPYEISPLNTPPQSSGNPEVEK